MILKSMMCFRFAEKYRSDGDLNHMLIMLKNLAVLESFPEEALAPVFTLDFMETLDNYMEGIVQ